MMVRPMVAKNAAMPTRQLARKPEATTDHHAPRLPSCATASLRATPLQLVGGRGQVDDQRSHDEGACQAPTQASTQNLTTRTAGPRRTHQHSASTSMISRWRSTGAPPPTMRYWNRLSSSSEVTISLLERAAPRRAHRTDACTMPMRSPQRGISWSLHRRRGPRPRPTRPLRAGDRGIGRAASSSGPLPPGASSGCCRPGNPGQRPDDSTRRVRPAEASAPRDNHRRRTLVTARVRCCAQGCSSRPFSSSRAAFHGPSPYVG